jgi:PDZ domain-containing protein
VVRVPLPSIERIPGGRGFAALSRRVRTLIVAAVLFVVLFALVLTLPVPYRVLSPGPTCNTLADSCRVDNGVYKVMAFDGLKSADTTGHLDLTTVSETRNRVNAFQAIKGWLTGDEVVVPETALKPPGVSEQQANQQNVQDFVQSQDKATAAALCEMGFPEGFGVISVTSDGPSDGVLAPGDALVSVDGQPADTAGKLSALLQQETPGNSVPVVVKRQTGLDKQQKVTNLRVTLGTPPKGRPGALLGITVDTTCLAPFSVQIDLSGIGGPSAGLMFALGIIDKVGLLGDLTAGKFIAGTGEISPDGDPIGTVGPIGGIQLKMIAARDKGATVFLAPAGNCSAVRDDTPSGLQVIKVDTLHHAVQYLKDLQAGKSVPSC